MLFLMDKYTKSFTHVFYVDARACWHNKSIDKMQESGKKYIFLDRPGDHMTTDAA